MKKELLLLFLLLGAIAYAQNVTIPDANFKAYLIGNSAINTNSDSEIQISEASAFTGQIDCAVKGITNLTGIEAFTALTNLNCQVNALTSLNLSNNLALTYLDCSNNQLSSLNISNNTALLDLLCYGNPLTALNVNSNTSLRLLDIGYTQISTINLSNNSQLVSFGGSYTNLTSLDLSSNTKLYDLACYDSKINSIIFPTSTSFQYVECQNNLLTNLNLTTLTNLKYLKCNSNNLSSLNLKNGNNSVINTINSTNNPNLTCIQVDNVAYSTNNWVTTNFQFNSGVSFSTNCSGVSSPSINVTENLTPFSQFLGTASSEQSFSLSGSNLTSNISVVPPANYEVSTSSGSGFAPSIQLTPISGTLSNTPIYIRLNATNLGSYNGNISITSGSLSESIAITGNTSNSTTNLIENKIAKMHLFPNPSSDIVKIHTNQPSEISFLAITGNLITQFSVNGEMNFDVSQFPKGIYFFQINNEEIIRFIKN